MKKLIVLIALSMTSLSAQADQCAYVSKEYGQKAIKLLSKEIGSTTLVKEWCEPCGETREEAKAKPANKILSVGLAHTGFEDYYEITINGKSVDMAYTYLADINMAHFLNIGDTLQCEIARVSAEL